MIIRINYKRSFTSLPNAIFRDPRLSIEARGLLAFLLTLPENWRINPQQIADAIGVGIKKLYRLFRELRDAGYMARSDAQPRDNAGNFGSFEYIVGPSAESVAEAVAECSVANLPQGRFALAPNGRAYNKTQIETKPTPTPSTFCAVAQKAGQPRKRTRQAFVFVPSKPWSEWFAYLSRNEQPIPEPVSRSIKGQTRLGVWMPTYRPPGARSGRVAAVAANIDPAALKASPFLVEALARKGDQRSRRQ